MKLKIQRYIKEKEFNTLIEYDVEKKVTTLLEALEYIKQTKDSSLAFESGCRSGVCGSCSVQVDGKATLACSHKLQEDAVVVEPLKNMPLIRDLVVDMTQAYQTTKKAQAWLHLLDKETKITDEDEHINRVQSDCILCGSCYSACPVFAVNENFLGPFALTRSWKYVADKREAQPAVDVLQTDGIWDCTLCNECTMVCPQEISSKADIEKLRSKSAMMGYSDPNFAANFGGFELSF